MKEKSGIFENEVKPLNTLEDHAEDCRMIDRSEEEETEGEAMG